MKCGQCGGSCTKISANLFGCATARNKGTCDNRLNVRRDTLEEQLLDCLRSRLMDPDLFREFAEEFYREINRVRMHEAAVLEHRRSEMTSIDRKIRKLVDAITGGADALSLNRELVALERRKQDLERELASQASPKPLIHPNLADVYRRKVADLHRALYDKDSAPEAFELIRALVAEITLTPDNGQLRIDLRGELAAILSLCSEGKKPASQMRNGQEQIKMVAGARSHLYRTRAAFA